MTERRLLAVVLVCLVTLVWSSGPAQGAKPVKFPVEVFDPADVGVDEYFSELCGTAVYFSAKGHFFGQMYFLRTGDIRLAFHPSFRQTLTSAYGSLETSDVGVDKISFNPDGTVSVFGTGIHLKVKGQSYAIGMWRLTLGPVGDGFDLIDQEYHGNFDLTAPGIDAYICSVLGPPAD